MLVCHCVTLVTIRQHHQPGVPHLRRANQQQWQPLAREILWAQLHHPDIQTEQLTRMEDIVHAPRLHHTVPQPDRQRVNGVGIARMRPGQRLDG